MSRTTAPSAVFFGPPASAPLPTVPIIVIKSTAHGRAPLKKPQKKTRQVKESTKRKEKKRKENILDSTTCTEMELKERN
jgi:hypothetical protein